MGHVAVGLVAPHRAQRGAGMPGSRCQHNEHTGGLPGSIPRAQRAQRRGTIAFDAARWIDQNPDAFIEELTHIINDPNITIEKIMGFTPAVSTPDNPLYRLIETVLDEHYPGAVIVPGVTTGFTDSQNPIGTLAQRYIA